jgi:Cu+-exporting ATPase
MAQKSERDVVCGMMVDPKNSAAIVNYKNRIYYFCHSSCAKKFEIDPEIYLNNNPVLIKTKQKKQIDDKTIYSCPMDPDIVKNYPGDCPKCGMPLEPIRGSITTNSSNKALLKIIIAAALWLPLLGSHLPIFESHSFMGIQALLSSIVIFGFGLQIIKSFFKSLWPGPWNMFTLVGLGVLAGHTISLLSLFLPEKFGHHSYFESSAGIVLLMMLGQFLENRLHNQANLALSQMINSIPKEVRMIGPSGIETDIPIDLIQAGDIIRIRAGEKIPLDGTVASGESTVDESMITGEGMPRDIKPKDFVYAGTMNINGSFTLTTTGSGQDTLLAKIINMIDEAKKTRLPIQETVDKISRIMVPFVLLVSLITLIYWGLKNNDPMSWTDGLQKSIAVLVIACPCALGLATPMAVGVGISKGAMLGILVRRGQQLENLMNINVLVVDKTGTITEGKPTLMGLYPSGNIKSLDLLRFAASLSQTSNHPLSKAIAIHALKNNIPLLSPTEIQEEPGCGISGMISGKKVMLGKLSFLNGKGIDTKTTNLNTDIKNHSTSVWISIENTVAGFIEFSDPIKPSAQKAIKMLQKESIKVILLSGDNEQVTENVAKQVGITEYLGNKNPADKADFIKTLIKSGNKVAMAGDGTNDAPALAVANVSIAMGTGTDLAKENSGIVLLKGDLSSIVEARNLSKFTINAIRQNLALAFLYNFLSIPIAAMGFLSPLLAGLAMSLSSISVLLNSLRLRQISL